MAKRNKTQILAECAVMVALATVLSMFAVYKLPNGGSITIASMVPIVFISFRHDIKWGLLTGLVYSGIQMILGFYPPPTPTFLYFLLVVLLDYVIAYTILGAACVFTKPFKNRLIGVLVGTFAVTFIRYICSFLSGILVWGSYAPEDMPVWLYSLGYNGSYMIPEIIISVIAMLALYRCIDFRNPSKTKTVA